MGSVVSMLDYRPSPGFSEKCEKLPSIEELQNRRKSVLLDPRNYPPEIQFEAACFAETIVKISQSTSPEYDRGIKLYGRSEFKAIQIVELMKMIEQWPSEAFFVSGERCEDAPSCDCSDASEYCSYRPACHPFWLDSWRSELVKLESQV
jgi:hypothetical protein